MNEYLYRANLFYSYCHKDEQYRERMEVALDLLKSDGFLSDWSDRDITAGTPFMPEIEKKQDSADLVVFLVSPDFLASDACKDEWRRAKKKSEEEGQMLVPIILRPCSWGNFDNMKDYLALPQDGRPVSEWEDEDSAWLDVTEQIMSVLEEIRNTFRIKENFQSEISVVEFISQVQQDIVLDDLFVFPHLIQEDRFGTEKKENRIKSLDDLTNLDHILIKGDRLCGKTSLCRKLFLYLVKKGQRVLLIDLEETGSQKNLPSVFDREFSKQFRGESKKWQQMADLTIIFDNLTSQKINYIEYALGQDCIKKILATTSAEEHITYFSDEPIFSEFVHARIYPMKHSQQEEIIRNWMLLDPRLRSGEVPLLDSKIDQTERQVNSIIMNNIVPRYPFFVLSILQTYEAFMPKDLEITAYGHCYSALIVAQILRLKISSDQIDACFNFLSWFANAIRQAAHEDNLVSENEYKTLLKEYRGTYVISNSTVNRLFDKISPILFCNDNSVGFCWSYSYFFFLGRYLADHFQENSELIDNMIENSYLNNNSLATIFIIHHSSNPKTINSILQRTESSIKGKQPISLDVEEVRIFDDLLLKLPDDIKTDRSVSEERKVERDQRDSAEDRNTENYEESPYTLLNDIYRVLKNVEILSQILKNKHGSIEIPRLSIIIESVVDAMLRIAQVCLLDESRIDRIVRVVENHYEGKEDLSNLREGVKYLILDSICACLQIAASSVSISEIARIIDDLRKQKATPAYDLVYFLFSLNVADPFTAKERSLLEDILQENARNEILKRLLSWSVHHYFNTHDLESYELIGKTPKPQRPRESIKQSTLELLNHHINGPNRLHKRL